MTKSTNFSWAIGVKEPYPSVLGNQTVASKVNVNLLFKIQVVLYIQPQKLKLKKKKFPHSCKIMLMYKGTSVATA